MYRYIWIHIYTRTYTHIYIYILKLKYRLEPWGTQVRAWRSITTQPPHTCNTYKSKHIHTYIYTHPQPHICWLLTMSTRVLRHPSVDLAFGNAIPLHTWKTHKSKHVFTYEHTHTHTHRVLRHPNADFAFGNAIPPTYMKDTQIQTHTHIWTHTHPHRVLRHPSVGLAFGYAIATAGCYQSPPFFQAARPTRADCSAKTTRCAQFSNMCLWVRVVVLVFKGRRFIPRKRPGVLNMWQDSY